MAVHFVLPNDIDDPAAPSGGNVYDRRLITGLTALGWTVHEHPVAGSWPDPAAGDIAALASVLDALPDDALVIVDGLVGSCVPAGLFARLRVAVLVHMPLRTPNEQEVLSRVQSVITTSSWTRDLLIQLYAVPVHRITPAVPGVSPAAVVPGSPSGGRLLCVAAVTQHKGHDVLAAALSTLDDLEWSCVCVGSRDRDAAFVTSLPSVTGQRFTGPLTGTALENAYAAADLVVLPSRGETFGMVVVEALAHGLPVVATEVGGVPEALGRDGDGAAPGILVPPGDPDALASALRSWLTSPSLRTSLRRRAANRRSTLTGWDRTATTVAHVLSTMEQPRFPAPETLLAGAARVSPSWLGLREPADAAARSVGVLAPLRRRFVTLPRLVVHDLGCGTGSMARWLAPQLPGPQRWVLHDRDPELIERAAIDAPGKAWDGSAVTVEARRSDITRLTADDLADADLITASALLDMLTRAELDHIAAACAGRPALFTLSVVGDVRLTPADPLDAAVTAAFNGHQRRSGLLGPDAVDAVVDAFARLGVPTSVLPSPWRLGADDTDLICEWLLGWVAAACEQDPALVAAGPAYARRRLAQAAAGELAVEVHHADVLAGCG